MAFSPWDNSTNCLTSDSINIYFLQYNIPCYQRTEQIYFFVVSSPPPINVSRRKRIHPKSIMRSPVVFDQGIQMDAQNKQK
ncbi:hypothetical protein H206_01326 [Candidatus Electrothrix aarhusensis]|uniref:Uncharacterized protein n=1 Tax=Candidatus Electrothrix aarhusensis TaxID=1859131 RepID=A0A3S3SKM9_9BACT|nr:hypothetical protein H206_01326 [Candidatus Electrothrix aarhusensis]